MAYSQLCIYSLCPSAGLTALSTLHYTVSLLSSYHFINRGIVFRLIILITLIIITQRDLLMSTPSRIGVLSYQSQYCSRSLACLFDTRQTLPKMLKLICVTRCDNCSVPLSRCSDTEGTTAFTERCIHSDIYRSLPYPSKDQFAIR